MAQGIYARIKGTGSYLPKKVITNKDLERLVDTNDAWITTRTGIKERHQSTADESTAMMGAAAAKQALDMAKMSAQEIDTIILATTTPDKVFPATALQIQQELGTKAAAFDIQAVCSGFIYGLTIADAMIKSGKAKKVLIIGSERFTQLVDYTDRNTCILFGDGAGAVVLEAEQEQDMGIIDTEIKADSSYADLLYCHKDAYVHMKGGEVFKQAVEKMTASVAHLLEKNNKTADTIDWFVAHQANARIIELIGQRLHIPKEKTIITLDKHGNTSAASIPLALDSAVRDGRIQKGQWVLLTALGGGITWGSALIKW